MIQKQSQIDKYLIRIFDEAYIQEKNNYQKNKITEWSYFLKLYKLRSLTVDRINQTEIYQPNTYQLFERIVKKFKVYLKKRNIKFYLVYLPTYSNLKSPDQNSIKYDKVIDILKMNNIETIDVYSELVENNEDPKNLFALGGDGHFNRVGYRLISEIVYRKVKKIETLTNNN